MKDIECPYCNHAQDINHDDCYGYDEDEMYFQNCENCKKVFGYTTSIIYHYTSYNTPCQNGKEHKWKQMTGYPKEFFVGKYRCEYCNEETILDKEASKKAIKEYLEKCV